MNRWIPILFTLLFTGAVSMVDISNAHGQGAKIQRETALLSANPEVIVRGNQVNATIQPFDDNVLLRVSLAKPTGEILEQQQITGDAPVVSIPLNIPDGIKGNLQIILETRRSGSWMPTAEMDIAILPGYGESLTDCIHRVEAVEAKAQENNPVLLRAVWAVLAFSEDLMERVKTAAANDSWDLDRRLAVLRSKTETLEQGKDPLEKTLGYQLRGYRSPLNGKIQLYSVYVPKGYGANPEQQWPLAVMLHGAWSNHHLALRRVMGYPNAGGEDDAAAKRTMPALPDVSYIVAAPNGYETMWYNGFAEDDVWRVMDEVNLLFKVDPNRTYLTGLSMGGGGTGRLGLTHPDRFAAIAPVCGFFFLLGGDPGQEPSGFRNRLQQCAEPYYVAENALHLPVKVMHGDKDPVVPPQNSVLLNQRLNELGYHSEIEMYPGVQHNAWVPAYENARIFDWFSQFVRDPAPAKVTFKTGDPRGGSSYWVIIEEPEKIREFARIDGEIADTTVTIKTENITRFSLRVPPARIARETVAQVVIDGKPVYNGTLGNEIRFQHQDDEWQWMHDTVPPRLLPAQEGYNVLWQTRQVYAYGTGGVSSENEKAHACAQAKSMLGPWSDVIWPVLPEESLTEAVMKENNIVLFATVQGSSFLKKYAASLPLKWENGQIQFAGRTVQPDQGLVFIYPNPANPEKYLLVCTAVREEGLNAFSSFINAQRSFQTQMLGDFAVLNPNGKPAWGGLFDKNWQVEETGEF